MKTNAKFIIATLGIGLAALFLAGCHHFGGGCGYAPPAAPVATATAPANASKPLPPAQPNAPAGHQH
jgi:hypothetical protein